MATIQNEEDTLFLYACRTLSSNVLFLDNRTRNILVFHAIKQAKQNNSFPQAVTEFVDDVDGYFRPNLLAEYVSKTLGNRKLSRGLKRLLEQTLADFGSLYGKATEMEPEQIWYHCRKEDITLEKLLSNEQKLGATLRSEEKAIPKSTTPKTRRKSSRRSMNLQQMQIPPADSIEIMEVKLRNFEVVFFETKALFMFGEDMAHFVYANVLIEKACELAEEMCFKEGTIDIRRNLQTLLSDYVAEARKVRLKVSTFEIVNSLISQIFSDKPFLRIWTEAHRDAEAERKYGLSYDERTRRTFRAKKAYLEVDPSVDVSQHGEGFMSFTVERTTYASYIQLVAKFRKLQSKVKSNNIKALNNWERTRKGQEPRDRKVQVPEILYSVEEALSPSGSGSKPLTRASRKNHQKRLHAPSSGDEEESFDDEDSDNDGDKDNVGNGRNEGGPSSRAEVLNLEQLDDHPSTEQDIKSTRREQPLTRTSRNVEHKLELEPQVLSARERRARERARARQANDETRAVGHGTNEDEFQEGLDNDAQPPAPGYRTRARARAKSAGSSTDRREGLRNTRRSERSQVASQSRVHGSERGRLTRNAQTGRPIAQVRTHRPQTSGRLSIEDAAADLLQSSQLARAATTQGAPQDSLRDPDVAQISELLGIEPTEADTAGGRGNPRDGVETADAPLHRHQNIRASQNVGSDENDGDKAQHPPRRSTRRQTREQVLRSFVGDFAAEFGSVQPNPSNVRGRVLRGRVIRQDQPTVVTVQRGGIGNVGASAAHNPDYQRDGEQRANDAGSIETQEGPEVRAQGTPQNAVTTPRAHINVNTILDMGNTRSTVADLSQQRSHRIEQGQVEENDERGSGSIQEAECGNHGRRSFNDKTAAGFVEVGERAVPPQLNPSGNPQPHPSNGNTNAADGQSALAINSWSHIDTGVVTPADLQGEQGMGGGLLDFVDPPDIHGEQDVEAGPLIFGMGDLAETPAEQIGVTDAAHPNAFGNAALLEAQGNAEILQTQGGDVIDNILENNPTNNEEQRNLGELEGLTGEAGPLAAAQPNESSVDAFLRGQLPSPSIFQQEHIEHPHDPHMQAMFRAPALWDGGLDRALGLEPSAGMAGGLDEIDLYFSGDRGGSGDHDNDVHDVDDGSPRFAP